MRLNAVIIGALERKAKIVPFSGGISRVFPLSLAFCSLWLASSIYLLSRDTSNILYHFSGFLGVSSQVDTLRGFMPALPAWFVYSLPDGLWMFSFSIFILAIWGFQRSREAIAWILIALVSGVLMEFLQALAFIPGQFDWRDLAFMLFFTFLPLCFTYKSDSI